MSYSEAQTNKILNGVTKSLQSHLIENQVIDPLMIGIRTGGVWVAEYLHKNLKISLPLASLNISFYRDDFSKVGVNPTVEPTIMPLDVDDRHIILVDDVLHTGRTTRAALNEIFDYGRPLSVTLVVLVERNGRELPINAQIVGEKINLDPDKNIKLDGPQPLKLSIVNTNI